MPDGSSDQTPEPARPSPVRSDDDGRGPRPARPDGPPPSAGGGIGPAPGPENEGGRGERRQRGRERSRRSPDGAGRPTPARELTRAEAPAPVTEADAESVLHEAEGTEWTVRVLGRSGGSGAAAVPLLLLGLSRGDDTAPELEALVVGRTLSGLGPLDLDRAVQSARPRPSEPDRAAGKGRGEGQRGGATRRPAR